MLEMVRLPEKGRQVRSDGVHHGAYFLRAVRPGEHLAIGMETIEAKGAQTPRQPDAQHRSLAVGDNDAGAPMHFADEESEILILDLEVAMRRQRTGDRREM